ncbi:MAG TPA: DNA polymerase III subunit gamma/tau [Bacteroidia bacterium]|nr:DNA polymerase III subunit gamma/tau [Bacteroidia bacterium]
MENFVVSARKYRPATFRSVVGQTSITTTLQNAIKNNHLAQAFLFCGPRGVGKTTCARILAKTINCVNLSADVEACNECESCKSFNSGQAIDISELDAASNNSVDDIRLLVDTVRIPPQLSEHNPNAKKVYVIDEVHMLSQAAFNAFLKTLEEPPRYAIFILATTERHKILPTILSRCQIFNFNRIQVDDIADHLAYIAKSEGVTAEPDALHVIGQKADGALRDACSIFDQVVSFAGNNLTYKSVIENLNILDYDYYFRITDHILANEIPQTLLVYNEILNNGFDGHNFIAGIAEHFRNLLVCKDQSTLVLLEAGQKIKEKYKDQSARCSSAILLKGLGVVNRCDIGYKSARNPRLQVEFALMQLCALNGIQSDEKKNDDSVDFSVANIGAGGFKKRTGVSIPVEGEKGEERQVAVEEAISKATTTAPITSPVTATTTATTTTAPVVQPVAKKVFVKSTGGLSSYVNAEKQNSGNTKDEPAPHMVGAKMTELITQPMLEQAWQEFANDLKSKGKNTDFSAFTMNKPVLAAENMVTFTVHNKMVEERLNADKTTLMGFLREKLRNNVFTLEVILSKEEGEQKIYTSQDKFKRLAEINPALQKLRQTFDLDLDY